MVTSTVCISPCSPLKGNVPEVESKSPGAIAEPLALVKSTVKLVDVIPVRATVKVAVPVLSFTLTSSMANPIGSPFSVTKMF